MTMPRMYLLLLLLTSLTRLSSALAPLVSFVGHSFSFSPHQQCRAYESMRRMTFARRASESDDEESSSTEPIFYDDFADSIGADGAATSSSLSSSKASSSSSSSSSSSAVLQDRLSSLRASEEQHSAMIQRNWKLGNWNVRGFSLDPWGTASHDDLDDSPSSQPVHISIVASDLASDDDYESSSPRIWVGRTDGSMLLVQLGTEYWTSFKSQLTVSASDNVVAPNDEDASDGEEPNTFLRVSNQLQRTDDNAIADMDDDDDEDADPKVKPSIKSADPFEILWQHAPSIGGSKSSASATATISHLLPVGRSRLFTSSCDGNGAIQQWTVQVKDDDDDDTTTMVAAPKKAMQGVHTSDLVCLESLSSGKLVVSIATDGSMAFWNTRTGDLVYNSESIIDPDGSGSTGAITSATTDSKYIFVGTSNGSIIVYAVDDLISSAEEHDSRPLPCGRWLDNKDETPVTSMTCAGPGSLGRGSNHATMLLLTGSQDGAIKQWEILSRTLDDGKVKLEQWPKLSTQRLPKKAHLFSGHDGAVTALHGVDATKFLSAAADGTIRAWSPVTGKEFFRMSGFTENVKNLCLVDDLLITNGMKQFVCVHDFNASTEGNDFELEMPEYEE